MFLKVGHRGAKGLAIENTIESFREALKNNVNAVEFDVRKTKDNEIIVIHDDNLKNIWGIDYKIKELNLKEIKKFSKNKIPTLKEVLDFLKNKKLEKILIEIKEEGIEKDVIDIVKKFKLSNNVIIISFSEDVLEKIGNNFEKGLIYLKHTNPFQAVKRINAEYVLPFYRFASKKVIDIYHKIKKKVIVWTINNKKEMVEYIKRKVDGIATDFPNLFKEEDIKNLLTKVEQDNLLL